MSDIQLKSKQLFQTLRENKEKYVNEELNISDALLATDEYFNNISGQNVAPAGYFMDSNLLALETEIVRKNTRSYRMTALSFDPRKFAIKTRNYFGLGNSDQNPGTSQQKSLSSVWSQLGEISKEIMYTVPNFNYLYGTFDAAPIEPVKKKRKSNPKDPIAAVSQPKQVNLSDVKGQGAMCKNATRILSYFIKLTQKHQKKSVCFYEFVIDPTSFSRTVEYIFLVSLLVQNGDLSICPDEQGMPYIEHVDSKDREVWGSAAIQSALSIDMNEWKKLIETFDLKNPVIPPKTMH